MHNYLILILAFTPMLAMAADIRQLSPPDALCKPAIQHQPAGVVVVWQHRFDDGTFDLAIARFVAGEVGQPRHITRLSFKGSKEPVCHFPALAVMPGGGWGWHVAWSSSSRPGVYYARVDGEAWVSSLPKKLGGTVSNFVEFGRKDGLLALKYLNPSDVEMHDRSKQAFPVGASASASSTLVSSDEGRNWDISPD